MFGELRPTVEAVGASDDEVGIRERKLCGGAAAFDELFELGDPLIDANREFWSNREAG